MEYKHVWAMLKDSDRNMLYRARNSVLYNPRQTIAYIEDVVSKRETQINDKILKAISKIK